MPPGAATRRRWRACCDSGCRSTPPRRMARRRCTGRRGSIAWIWCRRCFERKAEVNVANRYAITPLTLAAINGSAAGRRSAAEGGSRSEHDRCRRRDGVDAGGANRAPEAVQLLIAKGRKRQRQRNVAGRDGVDVGSRRGSSRGRCAAGEERRRSERAIEDTRVSEGEGGHRDDGGDGAPERRVHRAPAGGETGCAGGG